MGIAYRVNPGEGAFYGPKLEFVLRDAIGRDWQCGTLQVDLNLPERFDIHYVDEKDQRQRPVMLHRALFGSLERFTGILIEHYSGLFPVWLAPCQVKVLTISSAQDDYARELVRTLKQAGLRADADLRNEKIGFKIREHTLQKIPYLAIVGEQERQRGQVALRAHDGTNLGSLSRAAFMEQLLRAARSPLHNTLSPCNTTSPSP
jgi:threonyl-tRNA synthetase